MAFSLQLVFPRAVKYSSFSRYFVYFLFNFYSFSSSIWSSWWASPLSGKALATPVMFADFTPPKVEQTYFSCFQSVLRNSWSTYPNVESDLPNDQECKMISTANTTYYITLSCASHVQYEGRNFGNRLDLISCQ